MTKEAGITLSVVVPAYNEALRILPTLEKIKSFLKKQPYRSEVLVIDDCSTDDTFEVVRARTAAWPNFKLIRNEKNLGKGGSVRRGMMEVTGRHRLFSDADLSTPIEEVRRFLDYVSTDGTHKVDVVVGSRRITGAHIAVRQPVHREAAGRFFSLLVRLLTLQGVIDTQCGFKLFSREAANQIFRRQTIFGFGFDVEILFIAKVLGFKVKEAPVVWTDSPHTKVNFWRDSIVMFIDLLRIRWNQVRGLYR